MGDDGVTEQDPTNLVETGDDAWWKLNRKSFDGKEQDWWFASTAIPLLAATLAPLANVLSISALVTYWRMSLVDNSGQPLPELGGIPYADPKWCYWLNVTSLIFGFVGNIFLLFNFTNRIRYIVALPTTIVLWYLATGILIAITICMNTYIPPARPGETYTQGFWYAIIAATLYLVCSMILMVNMLGYFLGHYPQHFNLTDHQRTLILQTMLFFFWLAGGGAVFARIETHYGDQNWSFVDGLYFCDVTILTVGFGDLHPTNDLARGLVFPYSVGGVIMLGLVISSIAKFVGQINEVNVVQRHMTKQRLRTVDRTVSSSIELRHREHEIEVSKKQGKHRPKVLGPISAPFNPVDRSEKTRIKDDVRTSMGRSVPRVRRLAAFNPAARLRKPKLLLLREEKDRFEAMRSIQKQTSKFRRWWALTMSCFAFAVLWCIGAVVFWQCENDVQGMTYFQALYFCYVSLLTIGYGDLAPRSNPGRCFFVVWSLIAVPTMTILISDMGDTVISAFKRGTFTLADFTILPKEGIWRAYLNRHPWLLSWLESWQSWRRIRRGFTVGPGPDEQLSGDGTSVNHDGDNQLTLDTLAQEIEDIDENELARRLASSIKRVARDMTLENPKHYSYEEWVEFTRLIRFTSTGDDENGALIDEGLIEWDWIGENSPMMSKKTEAEFVFDRLCESLGRFIRRQQGIENESGDETQSRIHQQQNN